MIFLEVPTVLTKEIEIPISLNKQQLLTLVQSDPHFSTASNLKSVTVEWVSNVGNQKKTIIFDLSQEEPTESVVFSSSAKSSFLLKRIMLIDNDRGTLTLKRSQLEIPLGDDLLSHDLVLQ